MSDRVRVYDLARELGLSNRELLDLLEGQGIEVRSHSSTLEPEYADLVRELIIVQRQAEQTRERAAEAPAAPAAPEPAAKAPPAPAAAAAAEEERPNELHLKPPITVRDLADALRRKPNELIGDLFTMNVFAAINQVLELDVVEKVCQRHGVTLVRERQIGRAHV